MRSLPSTGTTHYVNSLLGHTSISPDSGPRNQQTRVGLSMYCFELARLLIERTSGELPPGADLFELDPAFYAATVTFEYGGGAKHTTGLFDRTDNQLQRV